MVVDKLKKILEKRGKILRHRTLLGPEAIQAIIDELKATKRINRKLKDSLIQCLDQVLVLTYKFQQREQDILFLIQRAEIIDTKDERGFFKRMWDKIRGRDVSVKEIKSLEKKEVSYSHQFESGKIKQKEEK